MAGKTHDLRPIQVFLDASRFINIPEQNRRRGPSKDFFAGDNKGFAEHKRRIKTQVKGLADGLARSHQSGAFVKVRQREEALAKSYRPMGSLFTKAHSFALVGAEHAGELLFQTTAEALKNLANVIEEKAEETPQRKRDKVGNLVERVSPYRSELGGIDDVQLYLAADRVGFSAEEAISWIGEPNAIGGYIVELFRPDPQIAAGIVRQMVAQLKRGFERIPGGMLVRPFLPPSVDANSGQPAVALSVQLTRGNQRLVELPFTEAGNALLIDEASLPEALRGAQVDLSPNRHVALLSMLAEQALVRSVELPPILETTPASGGESLGLWNLNAPAKGASYPVVAVVDGGVGDVLGEWKVADAGLVPEDDRDETHGTFIAGLLAAAGTLNPKLSDGVEATGCKVFDLDLFPRRDLRQSYYADIEDLFDTLDEKVKVARRDHGTRVFNLSFAIGHRSARAYSLAADRLDRIARNNDVIFVIAAGNLSPMRLRPPWPEKPSDATAMLAAFASDNQQITSPAEHLLGVTVGAVNPEGVAGHVPLLPTTYTRRGPGVGGARKPELAHYGGVQASGNTGLISLTPIGHAVHNCGTSFAAPLAAATVATLDHRLSGAAGRELLLGLPIHRAERASALEKPALRHIAREFVGFGVAPPADTLLNDDPSGVTLIFSERLRAKQVLNFRFAWPKSLVNPDGSCRGRADVTLSFTPPIDPDHREEAMRVQLEAHLHQEAISEKGEGTWESRLNQDSGPMPQGFSKTESYLLKTGLKWSPVKRYHVLMPEGRGNSSSWRLSIDSLARAAATLPKDGIAFSLLLTLSDPASAAPVREEMRLDLTNRGLKLADITLAHRMRPRRS